MDSDIPWLFYALYWAIFYRPCPAPQNNAQWGIYTRATDLAKSAGRSLSPGPLSSLGKSWAGKHSLRAHSYFPYWFGRNAWADESMARPSTESAFNGEADALQAALPKAAVPIPSEQPRCCPCLPDSKIRKLSLGYCCPMNLMDSDKVWRWFKCVRHSIMFLGEKVLTVIDGIFSVNYEPLVNDIWDFANNKQGQISIFIPQLDAVKKQWQ